MLNKKKNTFCFGWLTWLCILTRCHLQHLYTSGTLIESSCILLCGIFFPLGIKEAVHKKEKTSQTHSVVTNLYDCILQQNKKGEIVQNVSAAVLHTMKASSSKKGKTSTKQSISVLQNIPVILIAFVYEEHTENVIVIDRKSCLTPKVTIHFHCIGKKSA